MEERYAVLELNAYSGWGMWVASEDGAMRVHNPLQMMTFTKEKALEIVGKLWHFVNTNSPALAKETIITIFRVN